MRLHISFLMCVKRWVFEPSKVFFMSEMGEDDMAENMDLRGFRSLFKKEEVLMQNEENKRGTVESANNQIVNTAENNKVEHNSETSYFMNETDQNNSSANGLFSDIRKSSEHSRRTYNAGCVNMVVYRL